MQDTICPQCKMPTALHDPAFHYESMLNELRKKNEQSLRQMDSFEQDCDPSQLDELRAMEAI